MKIPAPMPRHRPVRVSMFLLTSLACAVFVSPGFAKDEAPGAEASAPAEKPARPKLEIGMSAEQVVALVGKPHRTKKAPNDAGLKAEIWYYEYRVKAGVHEEVLGTRDVPYINPKTGIETILKEPVYTVVDDYVTETTALVMVDGHLTGSKRYHSMSQEY